MFLFKLPNDLRNFNIDHVAKIPKYIQGKIVIKLHQILTNTFLILIRG